MAFNAKVDTVGVCENGGINRDDIGYIRRLWKLRAEIPVERPNLVSAIITRFAPIKCERTI
jgi:hypothetical protein